MRPSSLLNAAHKTQSIVTHTMHAGRRDWQAALKEQTGRQNARQKCSRLAKGRSYGSALIPVVRYNSRLIDYSNANAYIYTFHEAVDYQPFCLPIYSYSYYLFTIILMDYSNR